jgi:hypothetical protein
MVKNVKHALSITKKEELEKRCGDKIKAPVFYKPVGCEKCDDT